MTVAFCDFCEAHGVFHAAILFSHTAENTAQLCRFLISIEMLDQPLLRQPWPSVPVCRLLSFTRRNYFTAKHNYPVPNKFIIGPSWCWYGPFNSKKVYSKYCYVKHWSSLDSPWRTISSFLVWNTFEITYFYRLRLKTWSYNILSILPP